MRYSIEPRERMYVKGYGFLSFAKYMGKSLSNNYGQKHLDNTKKSSKYGQKRLYHAKKSTSDAINTASKRAIQKTAEATRDLMGNKIADKITSIFKKSSNNNNGVELTTHKKRYISPEQRQQIINELRLVSKKDEYF